MKQSKKFSQKEYEYLLIDGMLGRLSRWLRILGIKTIYLKENSDEDIKNLVKTRNSLLITRDKNLAKSLEKSGMPVILVPQGRFEYVLAYICEKLGIEPKIDLNKTLCPLCGGRLKTVKKEKLQGKVPPKVLEMYTKFYVCEQCGHIYWIGTHIKEMEKTIDKVRRIIYGKTIC